MPYRPDIDGLRALAVLLVIGYHASAQHVPRGFIGVDVFFVISGYLITGGILDGLDQERFSLLRFYARRCRRIVPALVVVLAATWAIGWRVLVADEFDELGRDIAAGSTFTTNIVLWTGIDDYFATTARLKPLLHLWSLGIEEQFYLLWPVLLVLGFRRKVSMSALTAGLAVVSFGVNLAWLPTQSTAAFYLLPARFWELLVGAWLVSVERRHGKAHVRPVPPARRDAAVVAAVAAMLCAAFAPRLAPLSPVVFVLVATLSTAVLIAFGDGSRISRVLFANRAAVVVGLMSYPLYLWHWPLLSMAEIVQEDVPGRIIRWGMVAAAFVLAWLTWRLVETPVRHLLSSDARPRRAFGFVAVSVCALMLTAGVGWATHAREGLPSRHPTIERVRSDVSRASFVKYHASYPTCSGPLQAGTRLSWCLTSRPGQPSAALMGDSHADHLFPGIAAAADRNWLLLAQGACPPIFDVEAYRPDRRDKCAELNQLAAGIVAGDDRIRTVVISAFHLPIGFAPPAPGSFVIVPPASAPAMSRHDVYVYGLSREVNRLEAAGRHVVLFLDVPEWGFPPTRCVDSRPFRLTAPSSGARCGASRQEVDGRQADYRRAVGEVVQAHPDLRVFDPLPLFCDDRWCDMTRDGELLYRDTNHLNLRGSRYVAPHFLQWLAQNGM